ncbi:MaoC/PaaZ C-terminal domain-containing protein [Sedimenticola selenatireducens]|uniref:3-hydroxybutyryl-CoA dehydratase n=1 Tax=Sedimenticola selenatireducens TaxID=191960 RepID=A0A558DM28_9GAMM|nr:MaoC/PaaZ C-terminal domain-containing protein [Sedimenticola selenatireducens]TVO78713.1 3-hydroxybutyryl-CoA dehydratase [Sedimenticola selenatireducens]TVT62075.1 MAG: 3-hydroxybutyryl-CoA dehydratase [Sedimenticola selenatireducens]
MAIMENIPYNELEIGMTADFSKTLTQDDLILFAKISGDVNPVHLDDEFAKETLFKGRIGHGMWTGSVISAAVATVLPGPGTIYLEQNLQFRRPVRPGDEITVTLTVTGKQDEKKHVSLDCKVVNQDGALVAKGDARVIAPDQKVRLERPELPSITIG